jgi:hypothetical protein
MQGIAIAPNPQRAKALVIFSTFLRENRFSN